MAELSKNLKQVNEKEMSIVDQLDVTAKENKELMLPEREALRRLVLEREAEPTRQAQEAAGPSATISLDCILNQCASRGALTLSSADPRDPPIVDPQLCAHPDDIEALVWALKKLREISQTEPLASQLEMVTPASIFDSDATLERYM